MITPTVVQQYTLYQIFDETHSYVGVTSDYKRRMASHCHALKTGCTSPLYEYIRGTVKTWSVMKKTKLRIWYCTTEDAFTVEREAISVLAPNLNATQGNSFFSAGLGFSKKDNPRIYRRVQARARMATNPQYRETNRKYMERLRAEHPDKVKLVQARSYRYRTEHARLRAIDIEPSDYHARCQRYLTEARRFRLIHI